MKRTERIVACALFLVALLCMPMSSLAQSPFDGTWHNNMSAAKLSPKPIVFYLSQGWYHCVNCTPSFDVKADGQDQPVSGQSYDTLSVHEVDPKTLAFSAKKGGTVTFDQTRTVSPDGKILTVESTSHPMNGGEPVLTTVVTTLDGKAPSGVHATSGSWKMIKIRTSENANDTTYKTNGDELTMTAPTGESFTAKLDRSDAPMKGSYSVDTISVKKIDAHTIEETDKRGGTVTGVAKMTVSPDGKKLTRVYTSKPSERVTTYVETKK